MTFVRPHYGHILINGVNYAYVENFGLRWQHLLFPGEGAPAVHFQPMTLSYESPAPDGHLHPMVAMPLGPDDPIPEDGGLGGSGATHDPTGANGEGGGAADLLVVLGQEILHPPFFLDGPFAYASPSPNNVWRTLPADGHLPGAEALIWSGPAIMAFPPDSHAPADDAGTPEVTVPHDALTRADLDAALTAMGDYHGAPSGGSELGAAFLPSGSDLPHGLDLAMIAPPPMPPPPEIIG
jgi:hypothetical protein